MNEVNGKAVVITGASRGIGASAAREFAAAGAKVVLAARTATQIQDIADEITRAGGSAVAMACDVSRYRDVESVVSRCVDEFGGIDVMINNAGVIEPIGHLATSEPEAWAHAADINYKGVYFGLRAAIPVMQGSGGGIILNISSGAAHRAMEGWSHYCSAKAAAKMLTEAADLECAKDGIRVMGLSPGTIATEMQVLIKASGLNPVSQLDPSVHADPSRPAKALIWMCSQDAASFAGQELSLRDEDTCKRMGLG